MANKLKIPIVMILLIFILLSEISSAQENYKLDFDVFPNKGVAPHYVKVVVFVDVDEDISVKVPVKVYLNGKEVREHEIIAFRGRTSTAWDFLLEKPGTYNISVNNLPPKQVVVYESSSELKPPTFKIEYEVTPSEGVAPHYVQVRVFVKNLGDLAGKILINIYVNGKLEHQTSFVAFPGQTNYAWTLLLEKPGIYDISVNNLTPKKVVVYESIDKVEVSKTPIQPQSTITPKIVTPTPTQTITVEFTQTPLPVQTKTPPPTQKPTFEPRLKITIPTTTPTSKTNNLKSIPGFDVLISMITLTITYSIVRNN